MNITGFRAEHRYDAVKLLTMSLSN